MRFFARNYDKCAHSASLWCTPTAIPVYKRRVFLSSARNMKYVLEMCACDVIYTISKYPKCCQVITNHIGSGNGDNMWTSKEFHFKMGKWVLIT